MYKQNERKKSIGHLEQSVLKLFFMGSGRVLCAILQYVDVKCGKLNPHMGLK